MNKDNEQFDLLGGEPDGAYDNMEAELQNMEAETKCVQVTPIMVESGAKDYAQPSFSKVATEIEAEDDFTPTISANGSAELKANLPEYDMGYVTMAYRTTIEIDCGFSVTIPAGYRAVVNSIPSMASKGIVATNTPNITEGRVKVYLTNVGKEIAKISHGDIFANMTLYPVYGFEWC